MKILSPQTDRRMRHAFLTNLVAGVGLEPHDLQVMGLVSYLCSTPQFYIKTENIFDYLIPQIKSIKIAVRFLTLQIYKLYLTIPNF